MLLGLSAPEVISRIITLLIAFTLHELSHAVTAVQLGDDTVVGAAMLARSSMLFGCGTCGSALVQFTPE